MYSSFVDSVREIMTCAHSFLSYLWEGIVCSIVTHAIASTLPSGVFGLPQLLSCVVMLSCAEVTCDAGLVDRWERSHKKG